MDNVTRWMRWALQEAQEAARAGEVPVGAVLLREDGTVLARNRNRRETDADPTAHAEMLVIREAARQTGGWRLAGATLVVTLEPCAMCAGAMVLSRIARVVYGADDPKGGAVRSLYQIADDPRLNHRLEVVAGVLCDEAAALLKEFFRERRPLRGL
ncbi:MAG: tRNA adenosine(34) deaminase TadA [Thermaerobacter sp.]|nr:tRNA adenosine(34) deaminase TadA [Thermaerobacter sp.]